MTQTFNDVLLFSNLDGLVIGIIFEMQDINFLFVIFFIIITECFFLQVVNIERDLVLGDGTIDYRDMYDYLHLTSQGYRRAFEPVYMLLTNLLHENETLLNDATLASPASENPPGNNNPGSCAE